jgi:two-component system chemotaxis sensor kinase CheA
VTLHSDERGAELRELFFETAQELLQQLNEETLQLEKHPGDSEAVRAIRRILHTIKGDAAACGFRELSELAHQLEDVIGLEGTGSHASLAEISFTAADVCAAMLTAYRKKTKLPPLEPLRKMIEQLASPAEGQKVRRKKAAQVSRSQTRWTEYETLAMENACAQGKHVYHIIGRIDPTCAMPIAARQLVINALSSLSEVIGVRPESATVPNPVWLEFLAAGTCSAAEVAGKCQIPTVLTQVKVEIMRSAKKQRPSAPLEAISEPVGASAEQQCDGKLPGENDRPAKAQQEHAGPETVLRVDAERIDSVLNLVGELIIGKSMLQQALTELSRVYPKDAIRAQFADAMAFQARVLNDLQRSVMKIRMVPVEQLFRRFPRLVRDVAKQCGKDVDLLISGQDTDLDKSILDAISEPLTHIVRNAVDHGIEGAAERKRLGKPEHGRIRLNAYHHGNQVVVEITDDGRGIDVKQLTTKAIEKGLLTAEDASRMSETEILDLVFRPGFSTAEEITEISGRGVGLDVVQSVLHRLKGTVHIETRPGQGTTFRLKLPLTLAIIKALLFRVSERLYAIPLNAVAEIARSRECEVHKVDNYEVLQLRNQVLPLIRLGQRPSQEAAVSAMKIFVLVISVSERTYGLIVESLEGEEELVIKALDDQTVSTDMVSGASILGDGRVVLILNISAVVERYSKSRSSQFREPMSGLLFRGEDRTQFSSGNAEVRQ